MKKIFALLCFVIMVIAASCQAKEPNKTVIYFFWSEGCPFCHPAKAFLEEMQSKHKGLEVKMYELSRNNHYVQIFQRMAAAYGTRAGGVPAMFIGDEKPIVGFNAAMKGPIEDKIVHCLKNACTDPGAKAGIK